MLSGMLSAVQFLTVLPCPPKYPFDARGALPYFPLCGLAVGLVLVLVDAAAGLLWPRPVVAMIDVMTLAAISGALHLDGLADTADGLYGHRKPEQALAIMKDSRVGAMGLVAVVGCLGLKWVAIANLPLNAPIWLLIVPAYARASVLFGTKWLAYGRQDGGTGYAFFEPPLRKKDFWGLAPLVALSLFVYWNAIVLNIGFLIIVWMVIGWYRRKINCVTGDMLGAMIEITETGLFLSAACQGLS